jgi:hypothetical protein
VGLFPITCATTDRRFRFDRPWRTARHVSRASAQVEGFLIKVRRRPERARCRRGRLIVPIMTTRPVGRSDDWERTSQWQRLAMRRQPPRSPR